MEKDQQPRSIRADQETFERFKQLSSVEFGNQGQALAALITLYETEQSKAVIPERKKEIENYQAHMSALSDMFVYSLKLNQDAELRVCTEFESRLTSKDETIIALQKENANLKNDLDEVKDNFDTEKNIQEHITTDLNKAQEKIIKLEANQQRNEIEFTQKLEDKNKLIKVLEDKNVENEKIIISFVNEKENSAKKLLEYNQVKEELEKSKLKLKIALDEKENDKQRAVYEKEKALLDHQKAAQNEKEKIQNDFHEERKEYVKKIEALQNQIAKNLLEKK